MKPKQTYVVLAARGSGWEIHGPLAVEYGTMKEAEAAAYELSSRYPAWQVGVYELRTLFGTQQKVVKQRVESADAPSRRKVHTPDVAPEPVSTAENVITLRSSGSAS